MKPNKKFRILACAIATAAVFTIAGAAGCAKYSQTDSDAKQNAQATKTVTSYISAQSSVYSSTAEVVNAVADTVVEISTESVTTQWGAQYIVSGAGSGVIVGKDGNDYYVITNNHVIAGANNITVRTRTGEEYSANLVATDDSADIAVVTLSCTAELKLATWGDSDTLQVGEDLIAIGNPLGSLGGTVTKGILSAKGRTITVGDYAMTLLQTDTAINPGNSGGGLFNMRGELIGVVNAKTTDEEVEGICFAIPANHARTVYDDLIEYGYIVGRATLPVTVTTGTLNNQSIVYVTSVSGESDKFKIYDRIYSVNGKIVTDASSYNSALSAIAPGDSVTVQVYRGEIRQSMWGAQISFANDITEFTVTALQYGA